MNQFKTFKAQNGFDNIVQINGDASYTDQTSGNYMMQVNQHPWLAPDGVSIIIVGGLGSTENVVFEGGDGAQYTVSSVPVNHVTINGLDFIVFP